jgi:hypothetical protein
VPPLSMVIHHHLLSLYQWLQQGHSF